MAEANLGNHDASAKRVQFWSGKPIYDPNAPSAIEVQHIVKKYGDFTAVDDRFLQCERRRDFRTARPKRKQGRSTLIRMMTTLIPITSGLRANRRA